MGRVLIIGYGNPLRGDDGLGWHAAQQLKDSIRREDVRVLVCHQLTPELAEPLSQAELAIFIDAACEGVPGTLVCQPLQPEESPAAAFTHHLDIPALLACARVLYGACPQAVLCSVAAETFEFTEGLSETVQAALPPLLDFVHACIDRH